MTYREFENFILLADRMIASNNLSKAEYGKGFQSGIKYYFDNAQFDNAQPLSPPDHYSIAETARRNGSRDVHAYTRGYLDACKGLKLEYPG